ncbi:WW domain-binding protein 4 [Sarcoptes scabiei]|nr:WW domain-binding protein 4 [Sarcoptes scabiei]
MRLDFNYSLPRISFLTLIVLLMILFVINYYLLVNDFSNSMIDEDDRLDWFECIDRNQKFNPLNLHIRYEPRIEINQTFDLLILIHSAVRHRKQRQIIRESFRKLWNENWLLVFVVGQSNSSRLNDLIREENKGFNDIIQTNHLDSYRNLTLKHFCGLRWAISQHSDRLELDKFKWILKMDDDIFLNYYLLQKFLSRIDNESNKIDIYCYEMIETFPLRTLGSKWFVSSDDYSCDRYPLYCSGWAYLARYKTISKLMNQILMDGESSFFWIDDVYITGILRASWNKKNLDKIKLKSINRLFNLHSKELETWSKKNFYEYNQVKWRFLFSHTVDFQILQSSLIKNYRIHKSN